MTRQLYRVDVTAVAYVMAEGPEEAERRIKAAIRTEDQGIPMHASACPNRRLPAHPAWVDSLPYDGTDERTVGELIEAWIAAWEAGL